MCSENQDEVLNRSAGHKPYPCNSVDVFSLACRREHKDLQKSSETETVTETEFPLHLGQDQGESGVYIVRQDGLGPGLQVSVLLYRVGLDACILDMNIKCHCVCVCFFIGPSLINSAPLLFCAEDISNYRERPWHISHFLLQANLCVRSCSLENSHGLESFSVVAVGTVQLIQRRTFLPKNQCF